MDLLPFLTVSVLIIAVPGADMAVVTQQVLVHGRRAGLLAVAGISAGSALQATAATLGLSALLAASHTAFVALKVAGAAYLVWLGVQALWRARSSVEEPAGSTRAVGGSAWRSFRAGMLTNLLNPKVVVFYVTFLPQFVTPGPGGAARTALLAGVFLTLAMAWLLVYTALLDRMRGVLARRSVRRRMEQVTGVVLVGLGVRLAAEA